MPSNNPLTDKYVVDGSTIEVGMALNHPKRPVLLQHFADGKAHLCSHTWSELEAAGLIAGKIKRGNGNPLPDDANSWELTSNYLQQLKVPPYVPPRLVESKVRVIAAARIREMSLVTEDKGGAYGMTDLCGKLGFPCHGLDEV